ncbi:MAG: hypothetical protein JNM56_35595 [Planctomycetia bacterium]|nr:hypothetical protein [Planctomycetia bacterium]
MHDWWAAGKPCPGERGRLRLLWIDEQLAAATSGSVERIARDLAGK